MAATTIAGEEEQKVVVNFQGQKATLYCSSTQELAKKIQSTFHLAPHRQRVTYSTSTKEANNSEKPYSPLREGDKLSDLTEEQRLSLQVKDLGPQVGWRTVFFLEYLGPLLIHYFFFFHGNEFIWKGEVARKSFVQTVAFVMVAFHYGKRLFESLFVHRFSHSTMPVSSFLKNCLHYYLIGGAGIAYFLYSPRYEKILEPKEIRLLSGLFFLFEGLNFYSHLLLMSLRPLGTKVRKVPVGLVFKFVSCPNYLFETLAWVVFSYFTGLPSAWLFTGLSFWQMQEWARKKHARYLQQFPRYPKERKAIVPFVW
jgi:very-long-chain enoyl-CoA reductase